MELSSGLFKVRAFAASEAIPIEGARIIIRGTDDVSRDVFFSLLTDVDGLSPTVTLPTPAISYSLGPYPIERPYSTYDISVTKEGYQNKTIVNVAVFAEREATLPVNMIPTDNMKNPLGNSSSTVSENENLE